MTDEKRETAEHPSVKQAKDDESSRKTGHLSHEEEARGYIAGFLELDYLDDLAAVLQAAEQITGQRWSVVVTAEGASIKALDDDEEEPESASDEDDDEEIIELDDEVDSEEEDLDEDSFSDFEDAFADEDD